MSDVSGKKPTVEVYLKKAQRALDSAELMTSDEDWDGACSKAYYAMFNAAHAALLSILGVEANDKTNSHAGLISTFGQMLVKPGHFGPAFGRSLNVVHQKRLVADYTGDEIGPTQAAEAIEQAEAFVAAVREKIAGEET